MCRQGYAIDPEVNLCRSESEVAKEKSEDESSNMWIIILSASLGGLIIIVVIVIIIRRKMLMLKLEDRKERIALNNSITQLENEENNQD